MRKVVLMLALGLSFLSFGQFKKVPVTDDELKVLGRVNGKNFENNFFNKDEFVKYNIANTLGYMAEFMVNDKVIYTEIYKIENWVGSKDVRQKVFLKSTPCLPFNVFDDEAKEIFKNHQNWVLRDINGERCTCYYEGFMSKGELDVIWEYEWRKYKILTFINDIVIVKLYRLEKE